MAWAFRISWASPPARIPPFFQVGGDLLQRPRRPAPLRPGVPAVAGVRRGNEVRPDGEDMGGAEHRSPGSRLPP